MQLHAVVPSNVVVDSLVIDAEEPCVEDMDAQAVLGDKVGLERTATLVSLVVQSPRAAIEHLQVATQVSSVCEQVCCVRPMSQV